MTDLRSGDPREAGGGRPVRVVLWPLLTGAAVTVAALLTATSIWHSVPVAPVVAWAGIIGRMAYERAHPERTRSRPRPGRRARASVWWLLSAGIAFLITGVGIAIGAVPWLTFGLRPAPRGVLALGVGIFAVGVTIILAIVIFSRRHDTESG